MSIPDALKTAGKQLSERPFLLFTYYCVLFFLFFTLLSNSGGFGSTILSILYFSVAMAICLTVLHRFVMQAQGVPVSGLIARGLAIVVAGGVVFGLAYRLLKAVGNF